MRFSVPGVVAVTTSLLFVFSAAPQRAAGNDRGGRVLEAVRDAKAKGIAQIEIVPPQILPTGVASLFTIGEDYSVFVARPVQIVTSITTDGNDIMTWYKLKIREVIIRQSQVPVEPTLDKWEPPPSLDLGADEVLTGSEGGTLTIDGVTVMERSPIGLSLQLNHDYVLCVYLEASGAIASLAAMREGVFELAPDGSTLLPLGHKDYPLVKDIYIRTGNSLEFLRKALQEQRRTP